MKKETGYMLILDKKPCTHVLEFGSNGEEVIVIFSNKDAAEEYAQVYGADYDKIIEVEITKR